VAAAALHSVAVGAEGGVWTWGFGAYLGHIDVQDRHLPTLLPGAAFTESKVVMVAAGDTHTVAVTSKGVLWAWGINRYGQLGILGQYGQLMQIQIEPALVEAKDKFGGSPVRMVACGYDHTLIVTEEGTLWTCGKGENSAPGNYYFNDLRVPTLVEAHHFGNAKVVSAAGGECHSAAVTEHGGLYTWGQGQHAEDASPVGLGHNDMLTKLVPTCVAPHLLQGARVGRCNSLSPLHALAFAMGTHVRLGSAVPTATPAGGGSKRSLRQEGKVLAAAADTSTDCAYVTMPGELVQRVVEACASWPEGQAGEMEGVVRLLGGMMKDKVSH